MLIKQSTKEQYELLSLPEGPFTPEMADELAKLCRDCVNQRRSVIIDATATTNAVPHSLDQLVQWQQDAYAENTSWFMAGLSKQLWPEEGDEPLNITPTLAEAIDMVAMEHLERELMEGLD